MELDDSQGRDHLGTKLPVSFVRGHQAIDNDPVGVRSVPTSYWPIRRL